MLVARSHLTVAACLSSLFSLVSTHTVITYPGWRGDNLHTTGNISTEQGLGVGSNNTYPYGMQWIYPCGGMPLTTNRTLWPVGGGAVGVQPGWFPGHSSAFFYINLGAGTVPENYSLIMQPIFEITGPSNLQYDGSFCLPQVPLPANFTAKIGDNATIQVIEAAQHGAALYSCVDITFADPKDVAEVNETNCFNSSDIGFELVFSTDSLKSAGNTLFSRPTSWMASLPLALTMAWAFLG